ncbi:hypothetical protein QE996_003771, partial [Escherichia coli]
MSEYDTGNSVPSASMPDAWDNMQSIDKFVNSSDETITTRTGEQLDTLHGVNVKADNQLTQQQADFETSQEERDAVVEETRQNLIPLSRQYMTLAAAQADIANIPVGSTTYYRSPDDSALAIEVINNGGTLEPTGRRMPSQVYIDSLLSIIQQMQNQSLYRDGVAGFSFPVISADKRVIGFKNDGGVYVADVEIPGTDKIPPRDGPQYISVVKSKNDGRVGIGFNPKNGLTFALLDDDSVGYIADRIGGGGTIPDIRGQWGARVFNPRHYIGDEYNTASVLDKGSRTFDARQLSEGAQDTLVMAAPLATAIRIAFVYGQSNAGLGGSTGRIVNTAPWAFSTWGFAGVNGSSQQGTVHMSAASLTDFVPALDYSSAQSPAICSAYGITQRNAELGRDDPGYIAATAWHGSQPISSFYPNAQSGYWNYENAVTF